FQGSARKGGTGLGLAIAAELARAHGGEITLLETGRGAAFLFTIPDSVVSLQERRRA
ncbi:MAG: ATP-binding protein, partial [Pseudomonadota bacterium]|nr:ATP-binding protein [Pseudomonadota bacterium]